jgi:ubiquinone/menaquinone biosynthesis C-methylase UbiE
MILGALEAHRIWSAVYDETPNPILALEMRLLARGFEPWQCRRFVDVGCGTGRWMTYAESRGARVFGIDLCRQMLSRAAAKPHLAGRLALASAERLPLPDGMADLVLCSFAIAYFADPRRALSEMARVSASGATVVVSEIHPEALEAGWKRGFRLAGTAYEIQHSTQSVASLLDATAEAGLHLERIDSACFGGPERELFRRAGRYHLFEGASRVPAIWTGIWRKP